MALERKKGREEGTAIKVNKRNPAGS